MPHLSKIKDYKSAAEMVLETEMTPAAREQREWLLRDVWDVIVPALARERTLDERRVVDLMEYAEFLPVEAAEAGLIDRVIYWSDLLDELRDPDHEALPVVTHADYAQVAWDDVLDLGDTTVAVVHAQGNIGGRVNRHDPLWGLMMGHESVCAELSRCRLDDEVKAVVFRVDSHGGESLASDLIAHEVERLAEVKPVVVSMVGTAASGGYMIAYKATRLMADPPDGHGLDRIDQRLLQHARLLRQARLHQGPRRDGGRTPGSAPTTATRRPPSGRVTRTRTGRASTPGWPMSPSTAG